MTGASDGIGRGYALEVSSVVTKDDNTLVGWGEHRGFDKSPPPSRVDNTSRMTKQISMYVTSNTPVVLHARRFVWGQ